MSSRNEITQANQTEFVDQAQFLERKAHQSFNWRNLRQNKNLLPFYILIGLFFFFVLLFVLRVIFRVQPESEQPFRREDEVIDVSPLNKRVSDLREELKENNPTKQRLPFPQVDLEFNIN